MTMSGFSAGIFFFGYMVLQIPGGHWAEHGSAKRFIMYTIIGWGVISGITGFVQNGWQLLTMRFLLGVAEGGLYPAILIMIANWFPTKEIGRANAIWLMSMPLSAVVTGPVWDGLSRLIIGARFSIWKALSLWHYYLFGCRWSAITRRSEMDFKGTEKLTGHRLSRIRLNVQLSHGLRVVTKKLSLFL